MKAPLTLAQRNELYRRCLQRSRWFCAAAYAHGEGKGGGPWTDAQRFWLRVADRVLAHP